jgi:hypothetical protein
MMFLGLALGLVFFHYIGRTEARFRASRHVPTLLRVLLDTGGRVSNFPDGHSYGACVWPAKRAVDRLFIDFPDLGEGVDIPAVVREAKRLGLVQTGILASIGGRSHLFVGYYPESRLSCRPTPEARDQRPWHCKEECTHDSACPFVNRPSDSV